MTATDRNTTAAAEFLGEEVVIAVRVAAPTNRKLNWIQAVLAPAAFIPFVGLALTAAGAVLTYVTRRSNGSGTTGRQLLALTANGGRVLIDTDSPFFALGRETPTGIPRRLTPNAEVRVRADQWEELGSSCPITVDNIELMVDGVDFKRLLRTVFEEGHDLPALKKQLASHYRRMRLAHSTEPNAIRLGITDEELRRRNARKRLG